MVLAPLLFVDKLISRNFNYIHGPIPQLSPLVMNTRHVLPLLWGIWIFEGPVYTMPKWFQHLTSASLQKLLSPILTLMPVFINIGHIYLCIIPSWTAVDKSMSCETWSNTTLLLTSQWHQASYMADIILTIIVQFTGHITYFHLSFSEALSFSSSLYYLQINLLPLCSVFPTPWHWAPFASLAPLRHNFVLHARAHSYLHCILIYKLWGSLLDSLAHCSLLGTG